MLFTFPSQYWFTIGLSGVFSLTGWSRQIHARFLVSRATQDTTTLRSASNTGLSPSMVSFSKEFFSLNFLRHRGPTTPTGYLETTGNHFTMSEFQDKSHIKDAILFFDKYADFLLTMSDARQYYIIVEALNDFMLKYVYPEYNGSVYELYFYAGALLNTFLKWEELGKSESVDEIVDIVISLIKRNNLSLT